MKCLFVETISDLIFDDEVKFIIIALHECLFNSQ